MPYCHCEGELCIAASDSTIGDMKGPLQYCLCTESLFQLLKVQENVSHTLQIALMKHSTAVPQQGKESDLRGTK